MGKSNRNFHNPQNKVVVQPSLANSLLDKMVDGREFESLLQFQFHNVDLISEIRRSISEIQNIRKVPLVCYFANVVKPRNVPVSIDDSDDLPFNEMISSLGADQKEIDIAIVTPGGYAHQVAKFVNTLRPRFEKVSFIILNKAMSAGTIFAMSGDEIIMSSQSHIGPIDPQVRNSNGEFIPAQSILTLINEIKLNGEKELRQGRQPSWTDLQILKGIDPKDIGNAMNASNYSIQLVEEYLKNYKFKSWTVHSSNGTPVTDDQKQQRSNEIASLLCNHSEWKNHGHAITRDAAWNVCKLKISHSENYEGLDQAIRRMWALMYWTFENTGMAKIFVSSNYCIIRNEILNNKK